MRIYGSAYPARVQADFEQNDMPTLKARNNRPFRLILRPIVRHSVLHVVYKKSEHKRDARAEEKLLLIGTYDRRGAIERLNCLFDDNYADCGDGCKENIAYGGYRVRR